MRVNTRALVCRCLPMAVVATVWSAAWHVSNEPAMAEQRWYITADGKLSPPSSTPIRFPGPQGLADADPMVFAARE